MFREGGRPPIAYIFICCLCFVAGCIYRSLWTQPLEKFSPPVPKGNIWLQSNAVSSTALDQDLQDLMKVIEWPEPPGPTDYEFSTSPNNTDFHMLFPRATYYVGEYVQILITARDHKGRPKTYGGDYFQAKLHSPMLKAGVTGSVTDHRNGTYTASFLLLWPGQVEISIRLVHSSEAIAILKNKRETRPDKVYFYGYFHGTSEVMECNVKPPGQDVCEYHDPYTGESWFCMRPKQALCSDYKGHAAGGSRDILTSEEARFLDKSVKEKLISSTVGSFNVFSPATSIDSRAHCSPGLPNPDPSGFYYQDIWYSRVCKNKAFPHPANVTECLRGKIIYIFGDSTTKQWWEFLLSFVPSLQRQDLHALFPAPQLAVDTSHKFAIQWQMHEKPLYIMYSDKQNVHYVASELERIGGNKEGLVVVINCMAHFVTYPVKVYAQRLTGIRDSVVQLMKRNPLAKVFIKSGNTGYFYTHGSDWLSLQLDLIMRAMFSRLPVTILDCWQMTSCHYLPPDIHPAPVIVKNEIDLLMSFICPT